MSGSPVIRTLVVGAGLLALFAVVTAIASAAGAINLGTAMTFGQVAFAVALVAFMLRGPGGRKGEGPGGPTGSA